MRNIYIIGRNFNSQVGGPANVIRGLVQGLKEKDVPVHEICLNETFSKSALIKTLLKILFTKRGCIVNVHTDGLKLPNLVYFFSKFDKKNDYYLTVHGLYSIESKMNGTYNKKYEKIERKLCKKFPNIICVSKLLEETLISKYHRKKFTCVVPNGVNIEKADVGQVNFRKHNSLKMILLGGIRNRKGILESLELIKYLNSNGINAQLDIYGNIDNEEIYQCYKETIKKFDIEGQVAYKGCLMNKSDVYRAIKDSDIQLCLSKWDTFNVAIIESLALCVPCIVSNRCGAISAITQGVNGLIIDFEDKNYLIKIKDYIEQLMKADGNRLNMIYELSLKIMNQYAWSSVTEMYLKAINYD